MLKKWWAPEQMKDFDFQMNQLGRFHQKIILKSQNSTQIRSMTRILKIKLNLSMIESTQYHLRPVFKLMLARWRYNWRPIMASSLLAH